MRETVDALLKLTHEDLAAARFNHDAFTIFDAQAAADLIADVETFVQTVEAIILPPDSSL